MDNEKDEQKFADILNKYSRHVKFYDCSCEGSTIIKWGFSFEGEEYIDAVDDGAYRSDGSYSLEAEIATYFNFSFKQLVKKSQRIRELEAELALRKLFDKTENP